jgi:hypothetical protein
MQQHSLANLADKQLAVLWQCGRLSTLQAAGLPQDINERGKTFLRKAKMPRRLWFFMVHPTETFATL